MANPPPRWLNAARQVRWGGGRLLFIINLQFKQQAPATANYARREAAKVDWTWPGIFGAGIGIGIATGSGIGGTSDNLPRHCIFPLPSHATTDHGNGRGRGRERGHGQAAQGHAPGRVKKGKKPDDHRNADGHTARNHYKLLMLKKMVSTSHRCFAFIFEC